MNIRIQLSRQTVKAMQHRLQDAYRQDDVRLVRRIQALLDHLVNDVPVATLSTQWGFTQSCFYEWLVALLLQAVFAGVGGLTTLGLNTVVMALPAVACRYLFFLPVRSRRPWLAFSGGFAAGAAGHPAPTRSGPPERRSA